MFMRDSFTKIELLNYMKLLEINKYLICKQSEKQYIYTYIHIYTPTHIYIQGPYIFIFLYEAHFPE